MPEARVHACECPVCRRPGDHPDQSLHRHINLFLSRLDEQQRRWYVAVESMKTGYGGDALMSLITGMNVETIRRGRRELSDSLKDRPLNRVRQPGAGRPRVEKKIPPSSQT